MAVRRRLVLGGGATGAAVGLAGRAAAAPTYSPAHHRPAHHRGAPLLSARARHLVGRFSYGVTPALARQVRAAGGARAWFAAQLDPASIADPAADGLRGWWPSLSRDATELWYRQRDEVEGVWEVM